MLYVEFLFRVDIYDGTETNALEDCVIKKVLFDPFVMNLSYEVASGQAIHLIDRPIQVPACEEEIEYTLVLDSITSSDQLAIVEEAIDFDPVQQELYIDADDFILLGVTAQLRINIVTKHPHDVELTPLIINLLFIVNRPKFVQDEHVIVPLTCSYKDADWSFQLPRVVDEEE